MENVLEMLSTVATIICGLAIAIVFLKVVWTLGLPYAMLRRGPDTGGWSLFPLIEFVPLLVAIVTAPFSIDSAHLRARVIFLVGMAAILFSYVHLYLVVVIGGWYLMNRRGKSDDRES